MVSELSIAVNTVSVKLTGLSSIIKNGIPAKAVSDSDSQKFCFIIAYDQSLSTSSKIYYIDQLKENNVKINVFCEKNNPEDIVYELYTTDGDHFTEEDNFSDVVMSEVFENINSKNEVIL